MRSGTKTITLAPEAGSQRMRDVINKRLTHEQIVQAAELAGRGGIPKAKLYFIVGLPGEIDDDVRELAALSAEVLGRMREHNRGARVAVNLSPHVPKAQTAFQWEPMASVETSDRRIKLVQRSRRPLGIDVRFEAPASQRVQAILARARPARGAGAARNARMQQFEANLKRHGLDPEFYLGAMDPNGIMPWSLVSTGVPEWYLKQEFGRARRARRAGDADARPAAQSRRGGRSGALIRLAQDELVRRVSVDLFTFENLVARSWRRSRHFDSRGRGERRALRIAERELHRRRRHGQRRREICDESADAVGAEPARTVLRRTRCTGAQVTRGRARTATPRPRCDVLVTRSAEQDPDAALRGLHAGAAGRSETASAVAAVHAGWRGSAVRAAGAAVEALQEAFGSRPRRHRRGHRAGDRAVLLHGRPGRGRRVRRDRPELVLGRAEVRPVGGQSSGAGRGGRAGRADRSRRASAPSASRSASSRIARTAASRPGASRRSSASSD